MEFDIDDIASHLDDDGDSYEISTDNGTWTFRLNINHDDLSYEDMEDEEVFGKVAWIDRGTTYYRKQRYENANRPREFTGAARKMTAESYPGVNQFWYEPPAEFRRFKGSGWEDRDVWEEAAEAHARNVRSIVSWGYNVVTITARHQLPDGYHREWSQAVGGIEAEADRAYLDSVFHDVLHELIGEIS